MPKSRVAKESPLSARHARKAFKLTGPLATLIAQIIGGIFVVLAAVLGALITTGAFTPTNTISATEDAIRLGVTPVTRNADWKPIIETVNGVDMAVVPAGCFKMGSVREFSDERPAHRVCFETPFLIDVTEVTQKQFAKLGGIAGQISSDTGPDLPRENITWVEGNDFCRKRGARLPTEAEWEYAARGPDSLTYPWGNDFVAENVVYNFKNDDPALVVISKPGGVSWVGAHDLSGNVWEWVNDLYSETYYSTLADGAVNPAGPGSGEYRILKGGSRVDTNVDYLRASGRYRTTPDGKYSYNGFRCALSG